MDTALDVLKEHGFAATVIFGLIAAFLILRTSPSDVSNLDELNDVLGDGQPTLVEFYSNV
jgi:hypothetical protein